MATEKKTEDSGEPDDGQDGEIDKAIDDLRGILKKDSDEETDFGADFDASPSAPDLSGGDFDAGDFGGGDFGGGDFDADTDFSGSATGTDFDGGADFSGLGDDAKDGASDFTSGFDSPKPATPNSGADRSPQMSMILDIPIDVQIILGTSRMPVSALMDLSEGSTIALDRKIGEPVEILVNGKLIGRGEITVLEDDETRFGIRLIDLVSDGADK